jgi:hypothetical protein
MCLPCNRLHCPSCGPRLRRERIDYYLGLIGTTPVYQLEVVRSAWERLRRRLGRAGANYLRFDTSGSTYLVLATAGSGAAVADLRAG